MEEKDKNRPEQPSEEMPNEEALGKEESSPIAEEASPGEESPAIPPVQQPFQPPSVQPYHPPQPGPGPQFGPPPGPQFSPPPTPPPTPQVYPPAEPPRPERRRSFIGPMILILLGVVFLLNNLGLIGWTIWEILWRFWPVWLIAIGIDMLFGRRGRWGGLLAIALVLTMLGGVFYATSTYMAMPIISTERVVEHQELNQPLSGAREARVEIESGVSRLDIRSGTDTDSLVQGSITPILGEELAQSFNVSGSTAHYKLQSRFNGIGIPFANRGGQGRWDLRLNEQIPMALTIQTGVGQSNIDLSGLIVTDLRVTSGVGETTLTLPARSEVRARISTGVGQTTVRIPAGTAARIRVQNGIGGVSVRGDFNRDGSYYVTPNYDAATQRIDLDIEGGVGGIRIETVR